MKKIVALLAALILALSMMSIASALSTLWAGTGPAT